MKNFDHWATLSKLMKRGSLAFIDLAFAQSVLKKLGPKEESHAALLATLFAFSRLGHLALDLSVETLPNSLKVLGIEEADLLISLLHRGAETFPQAGISVWICKWNNYFYLQRNWIQESELLSHLSRLTQGSPLCTTSTRICDSKMNALQQSAVKKGMQNAFSLLTGGPGTGKTFTAAAIVKGHLDALPLEQKKQFRIILSAPTGKAVAQLEGSLRKELGTQVPVCSGTLHSILGIKSQPYEEEIHPLFADLIIVDECSMIDSKIFSRLLASVQTGTRLILIGDQDQLPPVEAGSIFADLVDSELFPTTQLTQCVRSESGEILSLAKSIREGSAQEALAFLSHKTEIEWIDLEEEKKPISQLYTYLWEYCKDKFLPPFIEKPTSEQLLNCFGKFTLLSCMRKGLLGVDAVNGFFLNQSMRSAMEGQWSVFPIMITRNDPELQLFNGDHGFIVRQMTQNFSFRQFQLEDEALFVDRKGGFKSFPALSLTSFEYSYCQSVHKSQGSEYGEVLILAPKGSEVFGREVLYTAVTRAKHKVSLLGSRETLMQLIGRSSRKISGLRARLEKGVVGK